MDQGGGPRSVLEATQAEVHPGLFALRDFCSRLSEPGKLRAEPEAEVGKKKKKTTTTTTQRTFFERVRRDVEKGKGDVAFRTRGEEKENPVALLKMEVPPSEFF